MIKVAFICLGNICRSPMAELIFKSEVAAAGLTDKFFITSFGTSDEEEGNPIYPPAHAVLKSHGIFGSHIAKKLTALDAGQADIIAIAEERNRSGVLRIGGGAIADKIVRLCDYTSKPRDVIDPWYTRDFERAFADISDGCAALLKHIIAEYQL